MVAINGFLGAQVCFFQVDEIASADYFSLKKLSD